MTKITGATFMKSALTAALNDMWPLSTDPNRNKLTIFVTDGQPTSGQNPCGLRSSYENADITITAVGIGANADTTTLECLTDYVTVSADFTEFAFSFGDAFTETICETSALGLYNGRYNITQNLYGGKPIYESENGRIARYDATLGKWQFADTSFNLGLLIENSPTFWNYPLDGQDWTYAESVVYSEVDVLCEAVLDPTPLPTLAPTTMCEHVAVGRQSCVNRLIGTDVIMVLDSSTSISAEDYSNFKERLANGILEFFDDTSRLGVQQFSTPTFFPTRHPSMTPSSSSPTSTPSYKPLRHCPTLLVGTDCVGDAELDMALIIDTSESANFVQFKNDLADRIAVVPDNIRLALLTYGTLYEINFDFLDDLTNLEKSEIVRNMDPVGGATFTKVAAQAAYEQLWIPVLADRRTMVTVLVTDGQPSSFQSPCDVIPTYTETGILLYAVNIGEEITTGDAAIAACPYFEDVTTFVIDEFTGATVIVNDLATQFSLDCTFDVDTAFNGVYVYVEHDSRGVPLYIRESDGAILLWDGSQWSFNVGGEFMVEKVSSGYSIYPNTEQNWLYLNSQGQAFHKDNVPIICQDLVFNPTVSPTTSAPTPSPTTSPTNSPDTSSPSKSPTKLSHPPTASPNTSSPTDSPETSEPTPSPTNLPVSSIPTRSPSIPPSSSSPTQQPSKHPLTSSPTHFPTKTPSIHPTTTLPTQCPSFSPTTKPTLVPTKPPTADCEKFIFGTYCSNTAALDMLIIFDGTSGTDEFNTFKEELAQSVAENFPRENSRLAIIEYAITSTVVLDFDHNLGVSDWTQAILEMEPLVGSAWTKLAVERGFTEIWSPILEDEERTRITVIVSVDPPINSFQSPCDILAQYEEAGIDVYSYAVDNLDNGINCGAVTETVIPSILQSVYEIEPFYDQLYCIEITVWTPFNGQYERMSVSKNGYPQYRHVNGDFVCYWDEVWTFESSDEDLLAIVGGTSTRLYPESFKMWAFAGSDGAFAVYDNVPVECRTTLQPTRSPTLSPSYSRPTNSPSDFPSTSPTHFPTPPPQSSMPTKTPSISPESSSPTTTPTHEPTERPTTSLPTVIPSVSPTVAPTNPTRSPSMAPTVDCPTIIVGSDCISNDPIDVFLLIDTSGSTDGFSEFQQELAQRVLQIPDSARLAVMTYATLPETLFDFSSTLSIEEKANLIANMDPIPGATFTRQAVITGYEEIWKPVLDEQNRLRVSILVTDGEPSTFQNPCEEIALYLDANITIYSVNIGDVTSVSEACPYLAEVTIFQVDDIRNSTGLVSSAITETLLTTDCSYDIDTEFNGYYYRTGIENGRSRYENKLHSVYWNFALGWVFTGEHGIMLSTEVDSFSLQMYPDTGKSWQYTATTRIVTPYSPVPIVCLPWTLSLSPSTTPSSTPSKTPSGTPTYSKPTQSPSVLPTRVPSHFPSVEPSHEPSVEPTSQPSGTPSLRPSFAPFTNNPTSTPTKHPTFTAPSPIPTTKPLTTNPTTSPSKRPSGSIPSVTPTVEPSNVPSHMPSVDPSTMPTLSPTDDCAHFCVGEMCEYVPHLDMMIIVDGTADENEFFEFQNALSEAILRSFPVEARLSVIKFATTNEIVHHFNDAQEREEIVDSIDGMSTTQGATWTEFAFQRGYNDVWLETNNLDEREKLTVLISLDDPSNGQSPCEIIPQYTNLGINVDTISIGGVSPICELPNTNYDTLLESVAKLEDLYLNTLYCNLITVETPFNGGYSRTDRTENDRPVYVNNVGYTAYWDEVWNFEGDGIMMAEVTKSEQIYPQNLRDWGCVKPNGSFETYIGLPIICCYTPIPTFSPTDKPTGSMPSPSPSTSCPTTTPSTSLPTTFPSSSPFYKPTTSPTKLPTTSLPTTIPSKCPSSSLPTSSPSLPPTFTPPSAVPSTIPTQSPDVSAPTTSPSMSPIDPTNLPTVVPTKSPDVSDPSVSPSERPSVSKPTVGPSKSPTYSDPTVSPSNCPTTTAPTDRPTLFPTISRPTDYPTAFPTTSTPTGAPSLSPSVSEPTKGPSVSPTTEPSHTPSTSSPSGYPSLSPLTSCLNVLVGSNCVENLNIDLLLILDSSNSVADYSGFLENIAARVENLPPEVRFAFMHFGTLSEILFDFESGLNNFQKADLIRNLEPMGGATFTKHAAQVALSQIWENQINMDNEQSTMIITDGQPSNNQDPCDIVPEYLDSGISLVGINVAGGSVAGRTPCPYYANVTIVTVEDLSGASWVVENLSSNIVEDCTYDVDNVFNGLYRYTEHVNERPMYVRYSDGATLTWIEDFWVFEDGLNVMQELESSGYTVYPNTEMPWKLVAGDGLVTIYQMPILCRLPIFPPSTTPTFAPSQTPSVIPSFEPSVTPTTHPTTTVPSASPSHSPSVTPTDVPSDPPTAAPTDDCPNFIFGTKCNYINALDMLIILDSKEENEDVFTQFKEELKLAVENSLPDESRLALVQYATTSQIQLNFNDDQSKENIFEQIDDLHTLVGATWTDLAFSVSYSNVWGTVIDDIERSRVTLFISLGGTSNAQDPCDTIEMYETSGNITVSMISVGDGNNVNCPGLSNIEVDNLVQAVPHIETLFATKYCEVLYEYTPFNGGYSRVSEPVNDFPAYVSSNGNKVVWEGTWQFESPEGDIMACVGQANQLYPENMKSWNYVGAGSDSVNTLYENVPVECVRTLIPTMLPTMSPSLSLPTSVPTTSSPTKIPSGSPFAQPTGSPSSIPSKTPTGTPSGTPTVSSPTAQPSDVPSYAPTQTPSTSLPTAGPTQAPVSSCPAILVGTDCLTETDVDLLIILDSSSSIVDYTEFSATLSNRILALDNSTTRIAMIQFGTLYQILFNFNDGLTNTEKAEIISDLQPMGGATFMKAAFQAAYREIWTPVLDSNRTKVTIVITDGDPSNNQGPCEEIGIYLSQGIDIVGINVGDLVLTPEDAALCPYLAGLTAFQVDDISETTVFIDRFIEQDIEDCTYDVDTPLNGYYKYLQHQNERPSYQRNDGAIVYWEPPKWIFQYNTPSQFFAAQLKDTSINRVYPDDGKDWAYFDAWGDSFVIENLPIICQDPLFDPSTSPTITPSNLPSTTPSHVPTITPSTSSPTTQPSISPETSSPTITPSKFPTTENPTTSPSTSPFTSNPTVQPSNPPSSGMPTNAPTQNPVSSSPTKSPTIPPITSLPTTVPSRSPVTSIPTLSPSTDPTVIPSSYPTISPSRIPTQAPTDDCVNFIFGLECNYTSALDFVLIFDGDSNTETFNNFKSDLQIAFENYFPHTTSDSRFAIVEFATTYQIIHSFDDDQSLAGVTSAIDNMQPQSGLTWTNIALHTAFTNIWEPSLHDENRTRITVLINLEPPSEVQDPCNTIQEYLDAEIEFYSLVVGDSVLKGVNCPEQVENTLVPTLNDAVDFMEPLFETKYCNKIEVYTPLNGVYERTSELENNYPIYLDKSTGVQCYWSEQVWTFENEETGEIMAQTGKGILIFPESGKNWAYVDGNGALTVYPNVPRICVTTRAPTLAPTEEPTTLPTKAPTVIPTGNPSLAPSLSPSISPSVPPVRKAVEVSFAPTFFPTFDPTPPPVSSSPTSTPSSDPTTTPSNVPTKTPSRSPDTSLPTTHPSPRPTEIPTHGPTTTPSHDPTVNPTDSPSNSPSTSPTKIPSHIPTLSPTNLSNPPTQSPIKSDCPYLIVGGCSNITNLDLVVIIDESSDIEDYDEFKQKLADNLSLFPKGGSRVALVQGPTVSNIVVSLEDEYIEWQVYDAALNMERQIGANWARYIFYEVFDQVWTPVLQDNNRERITVYISDNEPVFDQSPCDMFDSYLASDIDLYVISVGLEEIQFEGNCAEKYNSEVQINFENSLLVLEEIYDAELEQCVIDYPTPFNGLWTRSTRFLNGYPVYTKGSGELSWDPNIWNFFDDEIGTMTLVGATDNAKQHPDDLQNWLFMSVDKSYSSLTSVPIACRNRPIATNIPSHVPTLQPTISPTVRERECPERVSDLQNEITQVEDEIAACMDSICEDDDQYVLEVTNGFMNSCNGLVSWVIQNNGEGASCDSTDEFGALRTFCCLSCSLADIEQDSECLDDDTFVKASSKNHFDDCNAFIDWLTFVGQGCSYTIEAGTITFSVHDVCCQSCESQALLEASPPPTILPTYILENEIADSEICATLQEQTSILEDYLDFLNNELDAASTRADTCSNELNTCQTEFNDIQQSCEQIHQDLQNQIDEALND